MWQAKEVEKEAKIIRKKKENFASWVDQSPIIDSSWLHTHTRVEEEMMIKVPCGRVFFFLPFSRTQREDCNHLLYDDDDDDDVRETGDGVLLLLLCIRYSSRAGRRSLVQCSAVCVYRWWLHIRTQVERTVTNIHFFYSKSNSSWPFRVVWSPP